MENEIWKPVKGYEGLYEVSNLGRVKSLDRVIIEKNGKKIAIKGKILSQQKNKRYGHRYVYLSKGSKPIKNYVHRLVAQAFIPNPDNLPQVDHIDGNTSNNCVDNLRFCTNYENCNYPLTIKSRIKSHNPQKVYQYTLDGKLVKVWDRVRDAVKEGFCDTSIYSACKGKYKQHKGFIWSYQML